MKKVTFVLGGFIILGFLAYFLYYGGDVKTIGDDRDNISNEVNDGEEKATDTKAIVESLKQEYSYEARGNACKLIEDQMERGDCFQEINANHLAWPLDYSKEMFYFPIVRDQSEVKDILFYKIDESDNLSEMKETDFTDEYPKEDYEKGEELLREYWYIFSSIIPAEFRTDLKNIYWRDAQGQAALFVGRGQDNPRELSLYIEYYLGDYHEYFKPLLIHEFAHMLTLNEEQGEIDEEVFLLDDDDVWDKAEADCPRLFTWACMNESSYINQYYNQFWSDLKDVHNQINWDDEVDYKAFFFDHEERFFNSYQGTNVAEDIAEAFKFFVMLRSDEVKDKQEMKYDKVHFFYQFDELVELRTMILENMFDLSIKDNVKY